MAVATRIYFINIEGVVYLVRAATSAAALAHVMRRIASIRVATQDDLVHSLADGVKVETAGAEQAPQLDAESDADKSMPLFPELPRSGQDLDEEDNDDQDEPEPSVYPAPKRRRLAAKYRCPLTGSTWSGRGLKPTWLKVALDSGKRISDFEVKAEGAA
jgi:hypothetical protein